jgi:hypothetical protein
MTFSERDFPTDSVSKNSSKTCEQSTFHVQKQKQITPPLLHTGASYLETDIFYQQQKLVFLRIILIKEHNFLSI